MKIRKNTGKRKSRYPCFKGLPGTILPVQEEAKRWLTAVCCLLPHFCLFRERGEIPWLPTL
ncbi:MAG: hypothetical protein D6820_13535 [Lentisphaerae bacterium]|nr:MAG: hypothetical protein D6820_13535 [Lentisphaerota bacterium]